MRLFKALNPRMLFRKSVGFPLWKIAFIFIVFLGILALGIHAHAQAKITFPNPIKSESLEALVKNIAKGIVQLVLVLAPVMIVITGFRLLVAATTGNQNELSKARKLFLYTLIGAALVVGAYAISNAVINFAQGL